MLTELIHSKFNFRALLLAPVIRKTLHRLAKTLKNLDINSPVSEDRKEPVKEQVEVTGAVPDSLKRRSAAMVTSAQPLRVMVVEPGKIKIVLFYVKCKNFRCI